MSKLRQIIHVDMDAFYASIEQRDHPELRGKAVIVGGDPKGRGVVSAASYEVRTFGVHSAMPTAQALRLCPHVILLPVRMARYAEVSQTIRGIFEQYTPLVEPISLDEAFLDVTGSTGLFGDAETIGRAIKQQIKEQTQLTASVGIAPNKFLAKLASDLEKPDGFVLLTEHNKQDVLGPLSVGRIWGVGKLTEQALARHGIKTIGQLRRTGVEQLSAVVGREATELLRLAQGEDDREVEPDRQHKSMSSERTFATDIDDATILSNVLLEEVEEVAQRLRGRQLKGRTITLKLRYGDFRTLTRSATLSEATDITKVLWKAAQRLFARWHARAGGPLRLLGFAASGLASERAGQQSLFSDPEQEKLRRLDRTVDRIRNRYGRGAVHRGDRQDRPDHSP
jgi:DNA polymerase-4